MPNGVHGVGLERAVGRQARPGRAALLLPVKLDRDKPLQQQLHDQLSALIHAGSLPRSARMPSTRALADHYGVSRMTIVLTYERLIADGLLITTPAGGTYVGGGNALRKPEPLRPPPSHDPAAAAPAGLDTPDAALFPAARWRGLLRAAAGEFGTPRGRRRASSVESLKQTLARWLLGARGIDVAPEQIVVLGARQRALEIVAHLLLRAGERVAVECPGDEYARRIWTTHGIDVLPMPVDREGIDVARLATAQVAVACVTPAFQCPLGIMLSPQRRRELLAWAAQNAAHVVEIDRVSDLRYDSGRPRALMADDPNDHVLHIGDFSAVLGPWVATAYLVVPSHLAGAAEATRRTFDEQVGEVELSALAAFIEGGHYARHVRALRRSYATRRDSLTRALSNAFGAEGAVAGGVPCGLTLAWQPSAELGPAVRVLAAAEASGLPARLVMHGAERRQAALVFGFAALTEDQLAASVARLAHHLRHVATVPMVEAKLLEPQAAD